MGTKTVEMEVPTADVVMPDEQPHDDSADH
jgi:hypothetical protein